MNIADKNGIWLTNDGDYPLFDGTTNIMFQPGEPVKATHTAWVKAQPSIKRCADPTADLSDKEQIKLDSLNATDEAAREAAQIAADKVRADALVQLPPGQLPPQLPQAVAVAAD